MNECPKHQDFVEYTTMCIEISTGFYPLTLIISNVFMCTTCCKTLLISIHWYVLKVFCEYFYINSLDLTIFCIRILSEGTGYARIFNFLTI